ncbi:MAG: succinylglutamate desuccinylase/aspartoacylase family protein [Woeseia sp.]
MKPFLTHSTSKALVAGLCLLLAGHWTVADEAVEVDAESVATPGEVPLERPAPQAADDTSSAVVFDTIGLSDNDAYEDPYGDAGRDASVNSPTPTDTMPDALPATDAAFDNPESIGVAIDVLADESTEQAATIPLADAVTIADATTARTISMLDADVLPGTYRRLSWSATEMFEDLPVSTPVIVVNGNAPGPTVCLTAAIHGDELNGIEMVRRVMHDLNPQDLAGAVIGVPIVNLQGFRRASRYLPDRRDLNRYFPGNPRGSAASRIAHSFFTEVIEHCDALIDLHTGSFDRANLPQIRADLRNPDVVTLTHGFGATVILHSEAAEGTLRHAASHVGIPAVTLEAGGPSELELKEVMHGVKGIDTLLNTLGMVNKLRHWGEQQPVYYRSTWVRANRGGILLADVSLGGTVRRGDLLGTITDPMNNASTNLYSPYTGRVIGMARNQVVMPGFAAFHVGIQAVDVSTADVTAKEPQKTGETAAEDGDEDYVDGMSE